MKRIVFGILAISAAVVIAQVASTVSFKWIAPTAHEDGTPVTAALTYNLYTGPKGTIKTLSKAGLAGLQYTATAVAAGACYELTSVESGVGESAHTPELCVPSPPKAPTGFIFIAISVAP